MYKSITLPESIEDITLEQYQKYVALSKREDLGQLSYNKRLLSIFTNLKFREIERISFKDYEDMVNQIEQALRQEVEFKDRFFINDIEFGFIPNLDEITTAEYVDLNANGVEIENLHKVMAVLFRPISKVDAFGNYEIEPYKGTKEYADVMKHTPLNIVNGSLVFFCNLSRELKNSIQKSTKVVQERVQQLQDTLKNGDGTQQ